MVIIYYRFNKNSKLGSEVSDYDARWKVLPPHIVFESLARPSFEFRIIENDVPVPFNKTNFEMAAVWMALNGIKGTE